MYGTNDGLLMGQPRLLAGYLAFYMFLTEEGI